MAERSALTQVAGELRSFTTDSARNVSVDMRGFLDAGELLTGTPSIECSVDLVVTSPQINSVARKINGRSVPAGQAVLFKVESAVAGTYYAEIVCATDGGQVIEGAISLVVEDSVY